MWSDRVVRVVAVAGFRGMDGNRDGRIEDRWVPIRTIVSVDWTCQTTNQQSTIDIQQLFLTFAFYSLMVSHFVCEDIH
jgi:hypothetical protein